MHSFPKIFHLGTKYVSDIFKEEVEITEKLDGSHFRFCLDKDNNIEMWGRQAQIFLENADGNFKPVAEWVHSIKNKLEPGIIYYGETLSKPRHNVLNYSSTPKNHFCLFGFSTWGNSLFAQHPILKSMAEHLDCDVVPLIYKGVLSDEVHGGINGFIDQLLDRESYLGGVKIEGVVIKNLQRTAILTGTPADPKVILPIMCAKFVCEDFKEKHEANRVEYKESYRDRISLLFESYRTNARWNKAVQHLKEAGELLDDPKDIGKLVNEIQSDIIQECKEEIKEELWNLTIKLYKGSFTHGFPEWYKRKLLDDTDLSKDMK